MFEICRCGFRQPRKKMRCGKAEIPPETAIQAIDWANSADPENHVMESCASR
jgi:hypothetical protein